MNLYQIFAQKKNKLKNISTVTAATVVEASRMIIELYL